jgi:Antibiotic biosynthesis monooxygenase
LRAKKKKGKKSMISISPENDYYTLINVFTVSSEKQQDLVDSLVDTLNSGFKDLPGFVSASVHKSFDGTKVVNYAQWKNKETFDAMMSNPKVTSRRDLSASIGQTDPHFYTVAFVSEHDKQEQ